MPAFPLGLREFNSGPATLGLGSLCLQAGAEFCCWCPVASSPGSLVVQHSGLGEAFVILSLGRWPGSWSHRRLYTMTLPPSRSRSGPSPLECREGYTRELCRPFTDLWNKAQAREHACVRSYSDGGGDQCPAFPEGPYPLFPDCECECHIALLGPLVCVTGDHVSAHT